MRVRDKAAEAPRSTWVPPASEMKFLFAITSLILFAQLAELGAVEKSRPNILYILADDLGYGDVHCLNPGRGKIATPHLDRFANQGMTFTDAHSGSSVCTPTRYGVLTGRYAWRSRLQSGVLSDYDVPLIAADRLTVPSMLKEQGYHTACIGKWHLGFTIEGESSGASGKKGNAEDKLMGAPLHSVTHDGPITRGFDSYFGFHHARMMKSVFENDEVTQLVEPVDMLPTLVRHTGAHILERAKSDQPFFIYLALNSPHTPIVPSKEWQGRSGLGDYGDFVMETDWAVGEVLAALDKSGVTENTLVFFTSDNGCSPAAGTDKLEKKGHFASGEMRGYKADIWDGGHRVPFMVRWPGRVEAGSQSQQLICHTDLMATCAEIIGAKLPDNAAEDSVSLLPVLLGIAEKPLHEAVVHHSINGKFAIREGRWKLEICAGSGGWGAPGDVAAKKQGLPDIQLYDLQSDLKESTNVQADHPEVVAQLTKRLEGYVEQGRSTPGEKQANDVEIKIWKDGVKKKQK